MRLTITLAAACASLALAACGAPADDAAENGEPADDAISAPVEPGATPAPAPTATGDDPTPTPTATDTGGAASVPAAIRGRWGLVPADCTSTRGDAKGLIRVSATDIRFYESLGRLGTVRERSESSIRADWAFTGEGMNWTRDMSLTVQSGGDRLVRREFGADAMDGSLTYTKCG